VTVHPDAACDAASRRTRKVGLGIMGFADLLLLRGEVYGSAASLETATRVMACIESAARRASEALAAERGAYPAFRGGAVPRRNASLLAVAPTGTLRLLAGCNGGLEPWLDPVVRVETTGGDSRRWVDRWLLDWLEGHAASPEVVVDALESGVPAESLKGLTAPEQALLRRAHEIPPEAQIALQARFQAHVDGGVSKTVHLAEEVSADEIVGLIHRARALGCKGLAFWRGVGPPPAPCVRCAG